MSSAEKGSEPEDIRVLRRLLGEPETRSVIENAPDEIVTVSELEERLSFYEQFVNLLGPGDKEAAAKLANQQVMSAQLSVIIGLLGQLTGTDVDLGDEIGIDTDTVETLLEDIEQSVTSIETGVTSGVDIDLSNLPVGQRGRAIEKIEKDNTGKAFFEIASRTFTIEVKALEKIDQFDPIIITENNNRVETFTLQTSDIGGAEGTTRVDEGYTSGDLANGESIQVELEETRGANWVSVLVDDDAGGSATTGYEVEIEHWASEADGGDGRYMTYTTEQGGTDPEFSIGDPEPTDKVRVTLTRTSAGTETYGLAVEAKRR